MRWPGKRVRARVVQQVVRFVASVYNSIELMPIESTVSDTIVHSWLWPTATGSTPLGYFSNITAGS